MGEYWTAPEIWPDATVFIIGGGPSLKGVDLETPLKDKHTIGVNASFRLGPWVDVCWFGDASWFDKNFEDLKLFPGLKAGCHERLLRIPWVRVLRRGGPVGLESKRDTIGWNSNSGASAINLAVHFGARRVVLLGFDMKKRAGESHWHNYHQKQGIEPPPDNIYEDRFLPRFEYVARDLAKLGVECINACPDSALECFPKMPLAEALLLGD